MLPGEVPDPHETRINSRTGHGSSARIRHSADNLPTGTLEIRDSEKPTNKPRPGEQRRIHASAINSREIQDITPAHRFSDKLPHHRPGHHHTQACATIIPRVNPGHHHQPSATRKAKTPETEVPGSCFFIRDSRGHTLNLASLKALHAHAQTDILTVNRSADRLQVRAEGALIADMRMRHGETGLRSLAAHCATSCHDGLPIHFFDLQVVSARPPHMRPPNTQLH